MPKEEIRLLPGERSVGKAVLAAILDPDVLDDIAVSSRAPFNFRPGAAARRRLGGWFNDGDGGIRHCQLTWVPSQIIVLRQVASFVSNRSKRIDTGPEQDLPYHLRDHDHSDIAPE